ncbi:DNA ligase D [Sphingomonas sp. ABOLD]|uniref:DNA ligase (ATP) n=1 Tax=Sphingomonas trueperi TaxID=53317 RepID=A0A7X5XVE9_9SPHN|nr:MULTISPECIES: DNA ligase D [unclassified Sphingomonas]NJB96069.1 bifunctional non-homologous end joining protein LigD [Sphingomonas trueperi]RSV42771.1 DNA ligase D [Sphingomonas sp. ABOLD]RSV44846.1 DNA ligase D [Sphingomonas sp. ABOLE]
MPDADSLARYNAKRDFAKTAEPAGTVAKTGGNRFIVQKHDATRLHWDFRLEVDGVLKSWAVTRGPSLDPDEKRLAVRTEDHPLSYADFEGTIPKGEYGGGTVMLWDSGTWEPIPGKSAKDLAKGHLHFVLHGERMQGEWLLIRLKPRGKEKAENWLLRKIDDEFAGATDELVETGLTSVTTGRTMQEIAEGKKPPSSKGKRSPRALPSRLREGSGEGLKSSSASSTSAPNPAPPASGRGAKAKRTSRKGSKAPPFQQPQLATLVDTVPTGNQWLHEIKYDGYRALIATGSGGPKIYTRSGLDWTEKFPGIAEAAATLPPGALIDGEIVAMKGDKPDFSTLQEAISTGGEGLLCFAFDLLAEGGEDLTALPQIDRKERLRALLDGADDRIRFSEHIIGQGEKLFESMCREGFEGVVSKRADAPYRGTRSKAWLKIKCTHRQEFVILGWSASSAKGRGFKSLLLGLNGPEGLVYAGKVGTGFNTETLLSVRERLDALATDKPAAKVPRPEARGAHWVKPELVAEIAFAGFTADKVVRHASFLGLREDKAADTVVAEEPAALPDTAPSSIKISSRDRVIFPESKLTKGDLADYYAAVAPIALPWLADRPISLVRCPQGRAKQCFFQKHDAGSFGEQVHHVEIREKDGSTEPYLYVSDADGMLACVQMGTIEFHGWGSRIADVEKPDRLVFDLDPDEGLDFEVVKKAADYLKEQLAEIGLTSWPMLSGGKGVHVVVPLVPQAEWPAAKSFCERFARALAQAEPERFTANLKKASRTGRIFIDYLRNQRGSTAVLPYVARARANAPVATPVTWTELRSIDSAHAFTIQDAATLIERAGSRALRGWGTADQTLPDL